ncbi:TetR/AcrR family transcriptional regulator [Nonomuraea sp. GTA35]|uniref:TetR/AcrR family transcriptional regulator n=1 Tax=Nonomuraea sp. GTA35 TaxID=1676746 RepID=UPI0035C26170
MPHTFCSREIGECPRFLSRTIWGSSPFFKPEIRGPALTQSKSGAPIRAQRPTRADARRNYDRLLASAKDAFAQYGADASLDDIARDAGVGNATLYRHFPSREALLDAVFRDRVELLCAQADDLLTAPSSGEALAVWLRALIVHVATYRGLATWLMSVAAGPGWALNSCQESIRAAGTALLNRAQQDGTVRPDISAPQLLRLTNAIALVTEQTPEDADQLLSLMMDGLNRAKGFPCVRSG